MFRDNVVYFSTKLYMYFMQTLFSLHPYFILEDLCSIFSASLFRSLKFIILNCIYIASGQANGMNGILEHEI